jgi:hypothetical protein
VSSAEAELQDLLDRALPLLEALDDAATARRPAAGKWSPREIIGHLIDSASNNHQRFVRAAFQDHLVFPGYEQDAWVTNQKYRDADWTQLLTLWKSFNHHIAHVMRVTPEAVRTTPRLRHNFHEIAWETVPANQPATLDYFMRDYVGHMRHHLRQILGAHALEGVDAGSER